jgi:hypothetical protein
MKSAYRRWLLGQVDEEVNSGCGRLSAIPGTLFIHFCDTIRGWPKEKVACLMRSRIKRLPWPGLEPLELTPDEREVADSFVWPVLKVATPGKAQPLISERELGVAELQMRVIRKEFKVKRPELKRKVLAALRPVLGNPFNLNGEQLFWSPVSGLTVETDVDLAMASSLMGPLQYWHTVYWGNVDQSNRGHVEHLPRMSISDLVGAGAGITTWNCLTDPDVDSAVGLLVQLVTNFLQAMPGIVEAARIAAPEARSASRNS